MEEDNQTIEAPEENTTVKENEEKGGSSNKTFLYIGVIVVVVIIIATGLIFVNKPSQTSNTTPVTSNTAPATKYKDGTYSAEGNYQVHVGPKHIKVTVTLKDNIITEADVVNEGDDPMTVKMQDLFISGYKPEVIGKNINEVQLSKVSGSSLTPIGFNNALRLIEEQAKS